MLNRLPRGMALRVAIVSIVLLFGAGMGSVWMNAAENRSSTYPVGGPGEVVEVGMLTDEHGYRYGPTGLWILPGTIVRWILQLDVHTVTAYHPDHGQPLRIPEGAKPFDSGVMVAPGSTFEFQFAEEGVYDYFCSVHHALGHVGRIVVGEPDGPGTLPEDNIAYERARDRLPPVEAILEQGEVPFWPPK